MYRVISGRNEPLSLIPGHFDVAGIERVALLNDSIVPGRTFHVAAHVVSAGAAIGEDITYTTAHAHEVDEVNVLVSERSELVYRFVVDDEEFQVTSPATVFIAAGSLHRMEAVSGEGVFMCIHLGPRHESS